MPTQVQVAEHRLVAIVVCREAPPAPWTPPPSIAQVEPQLDALLADPLEPHHPVLLETNDSRDTICAGHLDPFWPSRLDNALVPEGRDAPLHTPVVSYPLILEKILKSCYPISKFCAAN
jgi:hypothetical protein